MKLVVHDDHFHADDVFATAVTRMFWSEKITDIVRTRDKSEIESADIVLDVGGIYDPSKLRFDHHQEEGAGKRENGIPYASFGLVWKEWGKELCGGIREVADIVDEKLVSVIDASDNGFKIAETIEGMPREYVFDTITSSFSPTRKEDVSMYSKNFFMMVEFAGRLLEREIIQAKSKFEDKELVLKAYDKAEDKRILVLDGPFSWSSVAKDKSEILFVVSPSKQGDKWRINAVQEELFVNRKDLPKEWGGKMDQELVDVSGVEDAVFCHKKLFMAVALSREGAIELAKKAIEQ